MFVHKTQGFYTSCLPIFPNNYSTVLCVRCLALDKIALRKLPIARISQYGFSYFLPVLKSSS